MTKLPFACYCTDLKVNPKNWQSSRTSIKKDWFVFYRFYDPTYKDNPKFKKGKLVILKGMNQFKTIHERQEETLAIIEKEHEKLKNYSYNPITSKIFKTEIQHLDIEPSTSFILALTMAEKRITASVSTKRDLRSTLKFVTEAAIQLRYSDLAISSISRKHIKQLLFHIDIYKGESAHRYNRIRSYFYKTNYVYNRWLPAVNNIREKYEMDEWHFLEVSAEIRDIKAEIREALKKAD